MPLCFMANMQRGSLYSMGVLRRLEAQDASGCYELARHCQNESFKPNLKLPILYHTRSRLFSVRLSLVRTCGQQCETLGKQRTGEIEMFVTPPRIKGVLPSIRSNFTLQLRSLPSFDAFWHSFFTRTPSSVLLHFDACVYFFGWPLAARVF